MTPLPVWLSIARIVISDTALLVLPRSHRAALRSIFTTVSVLLLAYPPLVALARVFLYANSLWLFPFHGIYTSSITKARFFAQYQPLLIQVTSYVKIGFDENVESAFPEIQTLANV